MGTLGIFKIMKSQVYPNTEAALQDKMEIKKSRRVYVEKLFLWLSLFSGNLEIK